jgi:hypothetical protein
MRAARSAAGRFRKGQLRGIGFTAMPEDGLGYGPGAAVMQEVPCLFTVLIRPSPHGDGVRHSRLPAPSGAVPSGR